MVPGSQQGASQTWPFGDQRSSSRPSSPTVGGGQPAGAWRTFDLRCRAACGEMWCSLRTSCRLTVTACTREDRDLGYIATSATCDRSAGDLRTMQAGARGVTGRTWRAVCVQLGTVLAGGEASALAATCSCISLGVARLEFGGKYQFHRRWSWLG